MRALQRILALVPALIVVLGVSFGNRVHPYIGGLPFLFAWVAGLVVINSANLALIYRLGRATRTAEDSSPGPDE